MLKELIHLWRNHGVMNKAVDTFGAMIDDCGWLFDHAWKVFVGADGAGEKVAEIKSRDIAVNKKEREIRRLLVEHLTINPGEDASGCLALMSMVKDAERIGDYTKNIIDLAKVFGGNTDQLRYMPQFETIQARVREALLGLKTAFIESDEQKSHEILLSYKQTKKDCNKILRAVFEEDIPKQEALVTVLLARYLKRINSHISNVASGIIYPLDKIDFIRVGLLE